ncbi:hypothetical protein ScPMuIL_004487 [Solemya velum]
MGLLSLLNIPLALAVIAVILMLIGFVVPMWISLSDNIHLGLWYVLVCPNDESCDRQAFDESALYTPIDEDDLFVAIRWLHSIVFVLAVVGLFILIVTRCRICLTKTVIGVTCFLFAVSGVGMLITIGIFAAFHMEYVSENRMVTALNFPWSMLMSGIGGFFAIACAFALVVTLCSDLWRSHYYYDDYPEKHNSRRYDDRSSTSGRHHHHHHRDQQYGHHHHDHHDHHDHHSNYGHRHGHHSHHDDYVKRPSPYHESPFFQSENGRMPHYGDNMYRPYGSRHY